jgi:hypothetical protein
MVYYEMKKEESGQRDVYNDKRRHFLTILDNVLKVGEYTGGEERAGRPHPHPGGLLEGAGGGAKNGAAVDFAEALWR